MGWHPHALDRRTDEPPADNPRIANPEDTMPTTALRPTVSTLRPPLLLPALALLVLAGCGDDERAGNQARNDVTTTNAPAEPASTSAEPASTLATSTSAPDARALAGEYTFTIGSDDFVGRLTPDGTAKLFVEGQLDAAGTYSVEGDEVTVVDEESGVGDFCAGEGRYHWALDGDQLSMTLIDEACPGRTELWTAGWTKAPQP